MILRGSAKQEGQNQIRSFRSKEEDGVMVSSGIGGIVAKAEVCYRNSDGAVAFGVLDVVPSDLGAVEVDLRKIRSTDVDEFGSNKGMDSECDVSLSWCKCMAESGKVKHGAPHRFFSRVDAVSLVVDQVRLGNGTNKLSFFPWLWARLNHLLMERDAVLRVNWVWALAVNQSQVSSCGVSSRSSEVYRQVREKN